MGLVLSLLIIGTTLVILQYRQHEYLKAELGFKVEMERLKAPPPPKDPVGLEELRSKIEALRLKLEMRGK